MLKVPILFGLRTVSDGAREIKHIVDGLNITDKVVRLFVAERIDVLCSMRCHKTVLMHHHRQAYTMVFADFEGAQCQVVRFLGIEGIELDPTAVTPEIHIGVIAADIER